MEFVKGYIKVTVMGAVWIYDGEKWLYSAQPPHMTGYKKVAVNASDSTTLYRKEEPMSLDSTYKGVDLKQDEKTSLLIHFGYKRYQFNVENCEGVAWARNFRDVEAMFHNISEYCIELSKPELVRVEDIIIVKHNSISKELENVVS